MPFDTNESLLTRWANCLMNVKKIAAALSVVSYDITSMV